MTPFVRIVDAREGWAALEVWIQLGGETVALPSGTGEEATTRDADQRPFSFRLVYGGKC